MSSPPDAGTEDARPSLVRSGAAHLFVADVERPEPDPADLHHLQRVLRLRSGEKVTVCDGAGAWRICVFGPPLEAVSEVYREPRPNPPITIGFAIPKGDRPEWVVQKATELGIDTIVPLHAARSVVRWEGSRAEHHVERLRRVARETSMQARRAFLPVIEPVSSVEAMLQRPGATLAEPGGGPPTLSRSVVCIGPEGGWSKSERDQCPAFLGLGPTVLRVETASVAAGTLLAALRSGAVRSAGFA